GVGASMRGRHAAALALVVWYLMVPPISRPAHDAAYFNNHAPLRSWEIIGRFNDRDKCDDALDRARVDGRNHKLYCPDGVYCGVIAHGEMDYPGSDLPWYERQEDSECVATDDPRLKGN